LLLATTTLLAVPRSVPQVKDCGFTDI